jgi:oligopeptide/dipeptide ABC transporter ATP-binding protein
LKEEKFVVGILRRKYLKMNSKEILLQTIGLKKYFPIGRKLLSSKAEKELKAVDDVSFIIHKGESVGLIGESGCGKSTVARLVMGLCTPTAGTILYKNQILKDYGLKKYRSEVSMVFQDPLSSLDSRMTIEQSIEEPLRVHTKLSKEQRREKVLPILEYIGMEESVLKKYPHEFSGGQRQRIGIARALVLNPELVVCDEPVSALDVSVQSSILNLFKEMQNEMGLSYLFISHDVSVVKHTCDRIIVMYLGHIVEVADKRELFNRTLHPYTQALISAVPVPTPNTDKKRILLPGDPPSPIDPPTGCPFRTRCSKAMSICESKFPTVQDVGNDHFVACYLYQKGGDDK